MVTESCAFWRRTGQEKYACNFTQFQADKCYNNTRRGARPDARLEGMVDALLSLSGQMCGYCYTQLTDVEQEENGVYFYDRSSKFDMSRINAIFSRTPEGYANGL